MVMVMAVGLTYELAVRTTGNIAYRAAVGVALAAAFMLFWSNLAVGIIGNEDNPANLMYFGVVAVGFVGAIGALPALRVGTGLGRDGACTGPGRGDRARCGLGLHGADHRVLHRAVAHIGLAIPQGRCPR
jgi:hypothetical protein